MALTAYQDMTRFLLHDPSAQAYSTTNVNTAINIARKQVAGQGQCVRALLSGGVITSLAVLSGGSGYAGTATVAFSGMGNQATATATIGGGAITAVTLTNGGWGWLTTPTVTATGSTSGDNATFTPTIDNSASTVASQEVYNFSTLNTLAQLTAGIDKVIGITSIAAQWGSGSVYKPTLRHWPWSKFQANCRVYSISAMNFQAIWSQYGQGVNGSFYLFPIPSEIISMDIDAVCLPIVLTTDSTAEAIPYPWTDAVPYYAAYVCYMNSSRAEDAARMFAEYDKFMKRARSQSEIAFTPDEYDN